ncbi:MAG: DUF2244 domain-containing protein [Burkholderiales bacterium]|nr:DUF2244 domain-containing protein [Burkholderiales bacterium]
MRLAFGSRSRWRLADVPYQRRWFPNRSLNPAGRSIWLGMLGGIALIVAGAFALAGVWWVLPFAGLEIVGLVWAFKRIADGDSDFEALEFRSGAWTYRARRLGRDVAASGATCWLKVEQQRIDGRLVVGLRYAGRRYEVGTFLPEDQREGLVRELAGVIRDHR